MFSVTGCLIHKLTFHLHDDLCVVFALRCAHVTPVRASVLETTPPEDERGVATGYQVWENGGSAGELLVLEVLFAAVLVLVLVIVPLILVHHHVLPEPLDGLLAAGLEAAGEHALLRNKARHGDI